MTTSIEILLGVPAGACLQAIVRRNSGSNSGPRPRLRIVVLRMSEPTVNIGQGSHLITIEHLVESQEDLKDPGLDTGPATGGPQQCARMSTHNIEQIGRDTLGRGIAA